MEGKARRDKTASSHNDVLPATAPLLFLPPPPLHLTPLGRRRHKKTTRSHLQQEGLALGNFARSDALEGGVLPGVDLHVPQPREMRHLVCGGRTEGRDTGGQISRDGDESESEAFFALDAAGLQAEQLISALARTSAYSWVYLATISALILLHWIRRRSNL